MKILYLAPDLPPAVGGMQAHAFELIKRVSSGNRVAAVCDRYAGNTNVGRAKLIPMFSGSFFSSRDRTAFARLVREVDPDLLHVLGATYAPFVPAVRSLWGGPVVITCHGKDFLNPWTRFSGEPDTRALVLRGIRACDRVITVSRYNKGKLSGLGIPARKIRVIFNGVDTKVFYPRKPDRRLPGLRAGGPVLFTASRIDERKGLGTVLRAFSGVLEEFPASRYVIAGGIPGLSDVRVYRKLLFPFLKQEGIERNVDYIGTVRDPALLARYYNACDVFIMVPREIKNRETVQSVESFGIVYLEANACGKPVIASCTGGIGDAVVDKVTGLMVAPDRVEDTARAVVRLFSDSALRAKLGAQGRKRVRKEFEWNRIVRRTADVYGEVARKRALQEGSERI